VAELGASAVVYHHALRVLLRPTVGASWVTSHHALCFSSRVSQSISCVLVSSLCASVEFSKRGPTYPEYHRRGRHKHGGVPRGVWISVMTHLCDTTRAFLFPASSCSFSIFSFFTFSCSASSHVPFFIFSRPHCAFSLSFAFATLDITRETSQFGIRFCLHGFYFLLHFFGIARGFLFL
jgi:hypothetical protein